MNVGSAPVWRSKPGNATRPAAAGVTLIEMLVALVIFALIGVAGFAMLDQVVRSERLTEGRLARLGQMQRAMVLLSLDFGQAAAGSLRADEGLVAIRRVAPAAATGVVDLTYGLEAGALLRIVADPGGQELARQTLLTGVAGLDWQFYDAGAGWRPGWPPDPVATIGTPANPRAVAVVLRLDAPGQSLRRVVLLPEPVR